MAHKEPKLGTEISENAKEGMHWGNQTSNSSIHFWHSSICVASYMMQNVVYYTELTLENILIANQIEFSDHLLI